MVRHIPVRVQWVVVHRKLWQMHDTKALKVWQKYYITKLPDSGVLYGINTEFKVAEDHLICLHPRRSDIFIQHSRRRLFCLNIILFYGFMAFEAKLYEENIYLLIYYIFQITLWENIQLQHKCYQNNTIMQSIWRHNELMTS